MAPTLNQKEWKRHPCANSTGGFKETDEQIIADQRGVVWDLIKQLGQSITQGASLTKIAIPIKIAEPRSYLEMAADGWCYAPLYLKQAAVMPDPIERMKLVMTFVVAGLSNTCTSKKPFNPIIGETFEATFEDNSQIFCEQTSHHPPISNWQIIGPNDMYHLHGSGEFHAAFRGNSIKGHQAGLHTIDFHDGGQITYELPEVWVRGIMFGDRLLEYDGVITFNDKKNNLVCEIKINPETGSWFGWGKKKLPSDYIAGSIYTPGKTESDKKIHAHIEGSWLGCIVIDGETYWDIFKNADKFKPIPVENALPSDVRHRKDIQFLKAGDLEKAAEWKHKLEELQRRDAKLRLAAHPKQKN